MRTIHQTYYVPGTLSADLQIIFKAHADMTLQHVSAVATNNSSAQLKIGTTASDAVHMALKDIGDSAVPAEFDRDDFTGGQYPRLAKGDLVKFTLDFDGATGTAAQNVTLVATFQVG